MNRSTKKLGNVEPNLLLRLLTINSLGFFMSGRAALLWSKDRGLWQVLGFTLQHMRYTEAGRHTSQPSGCSFDKSNTILLMQDHTRCAPVTLHATSQLC